ncbi:hypothetical protein NKOR_01830 [Candidatus Nitrosopumilus koreensis AR1]|uniref:Uncharacterized protein n=1 Tax=Candidatus Nitrosopumilus koreensis AR1 TaxID=1229908 RepID=K0B594_9ARCH|nr:MULTISPECIES: hypothetical protein [Nitrosopumilus]AFS80272.1 hypothetical protein NKOR_01830 [Candidatus Nitrosopumilus koreensis AR1]
MNEDDVQEIVDFVNFRYADEVPGPVKFVVKRKAKKIEKLDPNDFPESLRKCTIEEFIMILKDAYSKKQLQF